MLHWGSDQLSLFYFFVFQRFLIAGPLGIARSVLMEGGEIIFLMEEVVAGINGGFESQEG